VVFVLGSTNLKMVLTTEKLSKTGNAMRKAPPKYAPASFSGSNFKKASYIQEYVFRKASCACGGGCPGCQAKSKGPRVSQPNDASEIEADQIAARVLRMPEDHVGDAKNPPTESHKFDKGEQEAPKDILQRKAGMAAPETAPPGGIRCGDGVAAVEKSLSTGGHPLTQESRRFFEPRFGLDLGHVRIHTGSDAARSARQFQAKAYAFHSDIVFDSGEYQPDSNVGRRLLAHELAHVVQSGKAGAHYAEKIHREARGSAGGCGICMNDPGGREAGTMAHAQIQMAFAANNPDLVAEYAIPVVEPGTPPPFVPEIDLSYVTRDHGQKIMHIGEIKPLDDAGVQAGIARKKLQDYARELKANPNLKLDEVFRMQDAPPAKPIRFFNPSHPPGCPPQMIHVQMTEPGVYQYYCEPPWSTLVKDPKCKCRERDDDEDRKKQPQQVDVPKTDEKQNQVKQDDKQKMTDSGTPTYVVPAAIGAGVSVAAAAYLRKKAIEQAERRVAQLAWRKAAEAAAARRAATAVGKGAAGKTVGKAAAYVEIAAAAALIIFYSDRVEAKPGPGDSSIETLYKAMTSNGTTPSPEMKALIESDPLLKQLAEEAGSTGDGSKLQEEMARRTLELIKNNPEMFSAEDLEFLTQYSKSAKSQQAPQTAEALRQAIDAAKAGKTRGTGTGGKGSGDSKSPSTGDAPTPANPDAGKSQSGGSGSGTPTSDKPQGTGQQPGSGSGSGSGQTGVPGTTSGVQDDPRFSKLNDENKKRIKEAPPQIARLFKEFASGEKDDLKLDDNIVKQFFDVVPPDLNDKQVDSLIAGLGPSKGKTPDEAIQALKQAIQQVQKTTSATAPGPVATTSTPPSPKPAKTQAEIIAELAEIAKKTDFSKIPNNNVKIQNVGDKVDGNTLTTYVYGKANGIGVVGYISGTIPPGVDVKKLKRGQSFTITITSQSPFVDKNGKVQNFRMGTTFSVPK